MKVAITKIVLSIIRTQLSGIVYVQTILQLLWVKIGYGLLHETSAPCYVLFLQVK